MSWNDGLTGKALVIAGTNTKYLRIMAGPGTGKTFAMKRRIARLLEQDVNPQRILVVTFTRVASAALVRELGDLDIPGSDKIRAGTLHSFCFRLLNQHEVFDFSGRVPRPLVAFSKSGVMQFEAAPMLEDLRLDGKREDTKRIRAFDAAWARLQSDEPGWPLDLKDRQFHDSLISWLVFHRAMLIGELVPEVLKFLRGNPECPELSAFDHVIADEYQDLNRADQVLLDLLTFKNAVVIGDENQSIYRFRHAHPQGINEYANSHSETVDQDLDECRRCPRAVVALANNLILNNHLGANAPKLKPMAGNPAGEVHVVQWSSMEEEAQGIASYVNSLMKSENGCAPGDVLVLSSRRMVAYQIRDELTSLSVPAHSFYHEEALEEDAAQVAFTLLSLLSKPDDRVAMRYWLGYGSPSWRKGEYATLRAVCEQSGLPPRAILEEVVAGTREAKGMNALVTRFKELQAIEDKLKSLKGSELLNQVLPEGQKELKILRESVLSMIEDETDPSQITEHIRNSVSQPEIPEEGDFVRIMSLQKSKGLTSKIVIVAGCIEGFIPVDASDETPAEQAEILKEQRRLFYVAITRATDTLILSSFAQMSKKVAYKAGAIIRGGKFSGTGYTVTSRFIGELGSAAPKAKKGSDWKNQAFK